MHRATIRLMAAGIGQRLQPQRNIRRRLRPCPERVALFQQRRHIAGEGAFGRCPRREHHRRQSRMGTEPAHPPAQFSDRAVLVHRLQLDEERAGCGKRAGGRRIGEWQLSGRRAPGRAIQHQAGELGLGDLRPVEGPQAAMGGRRPESDGKPRRFPSGASCTLVGGGTADALRREPREAGARVEAWRAAIAAIDHDPHAGDGQRGFGDGGGQHDAPPFRGTQRQILSDRRQIAMQRQHESAHTFERRLRPADFSHARQEGEHIARGFGQHRADGAGHRLRQIADMPEVARLVAHLHGMHPAGALDDGRAHQRREPGTVERGGHRQQP
jgi:hypothetical protein